MRLIESHSSAVVDHAAQAFHLEYAIKQDKPICCRVVILCSNKTATPCSSCVNPIGDLYADHILYLPWARATTAAVTTKSVTKRLSAVATACACDTKANREQNKGCMNDTKTIESGQEMHERHEGNREEDKKMSKTTENKDHLS